MVPLVVLVSAVHGWLLMTRADSMVAPAGRSTPVFATRQVMPPDPPPPAPRPQALPRPAPAAPPVAAAAPPAPAVAAPVPALPPATAPPAVPPSDVQHQHLRPVVPLPVAVTGVPPHEAAIPQPVKIHYDVQVTARGIPASGKAMLHWRHDGNKYEARLEVTGTLLPTRVQTSTGVVTREGLQPLRFSDKYRNEEATHFERDTGKVIFSANRPAADLLQGAQDRLSVVLQLAAIVGGDPSYYPPGTTIAIPTAGTRDSETWIFAVDGEEDIQLPIGQLRALKLSRQPRKDYDTRVELWLAPGMDYAPVRLRLTYPNGDSVDQRWSSADKG